MKYHPLLEDLAKWQNEEHFFSERYHWWKQWADLSGKELTVDLLEQDEFKAPTVSADCETGEEIHEISTFYFSHNIGLLIKKEFEKLEQEITEKFVQYIHSSQRNNIRSLLLEQLQEINEENKKLSIDDFYKNLIKKQFDENLEKLKIKALALEKKIPDKKSWDINYYRDFVDDDGNFLDFFNRLKEEGLIAKETNLTHFKQFFGNRNPSKKIRWQGNPAEFKTFIDFLISKGYISYKHQWKAFRESFVTDFPMTNLSSSTPLTTEDGIKRIEDIVDELKT